MKWKIVTDTGCDIRSYDNLSSDIDFSFVPMKIIVGDQEFVDTADLDTESMMDTMYKYNGKTSTSCPCPDDWYNEFKDADFIFALTITSGLSGSYNSAFSAKEMLLEEYPDKKIMLIDTMSAGPGMSLLVHKLVELIKEYDDFEKVRIAISLYIKKTSLVFMLESFDNFVKNGRVSKVVGTLASMLNIRLICGPSAEGTIEMLHKCRGSIKGITTMIQEMISRGYSGGRVIITHSHNIEGASQLMKQIIEKFDNANIEIMPTSGLCSYYAESKGLLIGFEC